MNDHIDPETQRIFHSAFFATVILNGLIALADTVAGFFFLFERHIASLAYTYQYPFSHLVQAVLIELMRQNQLMAIIYFFSHGIIKLFLVWGLLTNRLWAYPSAIIFLGLFSAYQVYDLFVRFSWFTVLLLFVNLITIFFIAREYRSL